jgi:hypothetical protein
MFTIKDDFEPLPVLRQPELQSGNVSAERAALAFRNLACQFEVAMQANSSFTVVADLSCGETL